MKLKMAKGEALKDKQLGQLYYIVVEFHRHINY